MLEGFTVAARDVLYSSLSGLWFNLRSDCHCLYNGKEFPPLTMPDICN